MNNCIFAQGLCFYKIFCVFVVGSVLGDIIETIFCYLKYKKSMSRSSLVYGHLSVIWGFAFVIATMLFYHMESAGIFSVFLAGTVLGGAYEYLCSFMAEKCLGVKFWDYSKFAHNLSGRINLEYCFGWGAATTIWIKSIFPILEKGIEGIPFVAGTIFCNIIFVLLCMDAFISYVAIRRYRIRNDKTYVEKEFWNYFDRRFSNQRMEQIYPHMKMCADDERINNFHEKASLLHEKLSGGVYDQG